ncbi:MAG: class II aldolase/adducin family protein [Solirubrobacterales bacterium]
MSDDAAARQEVLAGARAMLREGLVVGMVGNVSRRLGDRILITPTRVPYAEMEADDLAVVDLQGEPTQGGRAPSRELPVHLAIYESRADVAAIAHTHSPYATAWSFLGRELLPRTEENDYYGVGRILTAAPAPAGSEELAAHAVELIGQSSAILLANHGALAAARTVADALDVARVVERQAQIAWLLLAQADALAGASPDPPPAVRRVGPEASASVRE